MTSDIRQLDQMEWQQAALYYGLRSCALFAPHTFVLEKRLRLDQTMQLETIWLTARNGAAGSGSLIEMPKILTPLPNSQVNELMFSVVTFEERSINMTAGTGSIITAEGWSQMIAEFMRGWIVGQAGALYPDSVSVEPAEDWITEGDSGKGFPGVMAYRARARQKLSRRIYPRCGPPVLAAAGYVITLANSAGSPNATIYFTTDGSFPGDPNEMTDTETNSQPYTAPFTVASGTLIQWAAYAPGNFPSHVGSQIVT